MHQYAGELSWTYFNERKEVGRSREERAVWVMISTVFFLPKLLCAAQRSSGAADRFWTPWCRPPRLMPPGLALWGYEGVWKQRNGTGGAYHQWCESFQLLM